MWYHSTRNSVPMVDSAQAVLQGLAPDGGLYVMTKMPAFDVEACLKKDMLGQMEQILAAFTRCGRNGTFGTGGLCR